MRWLLSVSAETTITRHQHLVSSRGTASYNLTPHLGNKGDHLLIGPCPVLTMKAPRVGWADLRAPKHAVRVQQDRMTGAGISPLFRQPVLLSSQRALRLAESRVRERRRESGRGLLLPSARYVMSSSHSRHAARVLTRRDRQFMGERGGDARLVCRTTAAGFMQPPVGAEPRKGCRSRLCDSTYVLETADFTLGQHRA